MTSFEIAMVSITAAGFLLTAAGTVAACVWGVAQIKQYTVEQIAAEQALRAREIAKVAETFAKDQKTQDHNYGEMGAALRRFIEAVEKEMHEIEIWGRDNYALKEDVKYIRDDIKAMASSIKQDFKDLTAKIDAKS
jgi:hypothetical protein